MRLWMFFASLYNNIRRLYVYIQYLLILAPKGTIGTDISMLNFVMDWYDFDVTFPTNSSLEM